MPAPARPLRMGGGAPPPSPSSLGLSLLSVFLGNWMGWQKRGSSLGGTAYTSGRGVGRYLSGPELQLASTSIATLTTTMPSPGLRMGHISQSSGNRGSFPPEPLGRGL